MAGYNKVIMIGNLTRDPSLTYLPNSQTAVCEIGLAVNRRFRGKDGQQQEKVCFIDCRAYAKRAEVLNQYLRKGQPLMIEGTLELDRWEAQDGSARSKHRITIDNFQFLGGGGQGGGQGSQGGDYNSAPAPSQPSPGTPSDAPPAPNAYDDIPPQSDIPF